MNEVQPTGIPPVQTGAQNIVPNPNFVPPISEPPPEPQGPQWYKGDKNFVFKLKDLVVTEQFAIWQGWQQTITPEEMIQRFGVVLTFPVKEGTLPGLDGAHRTMEQLKYLKGADFKRLYPKLGKNSRYVRNIYIGGVEYKYGFSNSSNNKLVTMLSMTPGVIPPVEFKQTFDRNLQAQQMYNVMVNDGTAPQIALSHPIGTNTTQPVVQPAPVAVVPPNATSQAPVNPHPNTTPFTIKDGEKQILNTIQGLPNKLDQAKFIEIFVKNLAKKEFGSLSPEIASQRALYIFVNLYKK